MKYNVGERLRIADKGKLYLSYYDWVSDNKMTLAANEKVRTLWADYLSGNEVACTEGNEVTIVAKGTHGEFKDIPMYLCEDDNGNPVLISEYGLGPVEDEPTTVLNWADLKMGDIIRHKVYGYKLMITGTDDSQYTKCHVFAGDSWRTDKELMDCWELAEN